MARHDFTLENLKSLDDGRIVAAFNQAIKRCVADCTDRPATKDARKVTLDVSLTPRIDEDGQMGSVGVKCVIKDSAPARKSREYDMGWVRGDGLVFNDMSDEDINQRTLDEMEH